MDAPDPAPQESHDELYDRVIDLVMRGEAVDVEAIVAARPDLPEELRAKLRKLVRVAGSFGKEAPQQAFAPASLPFEKLGQYKLLQPLGEGGMGMVYLAEHEFLRRRVALKIVRPELRLSETTRQRFQREALAVARLKHEHIVAVHDAGEERGIAYLAMELVDGEGLDETLARLRGADARMEPRSAARLGREIAAALHCAHQAGVLHRDVKPGNIRIDARGRALLLDFGLAQAEGTASVSMTGMFRGTPAYASPEQVEADAVELDARSDVYSLGATLYECLAGKPPFEGATTLQLFQRILAAPPRPLREIDPKVDAGLQAIVLRALAKRREERQKDAQQLADELDAWLEAQGDAQAPAPPRRDLRLVHGIVLVLAAAGSAWWLWGADPSATQGTAEPAATRTAPLPALPARATLSLFGPPGLPFGERLLGWERTLGMGTFGDDEDSDGAIGVCMDGLALKGHALTAQAACVRAVLEPLPVYDAQTGAEAPTRACGLALEYADGRVAAVALVVDGAATRLEPCALRATDSGLWSRGPATSTLAARSAPLEIGLRFDADDVQLEWNDGAPRTSLLPRALLGRGRPVRAHLWVDGGNVRCARLLVEEL